MNFHYSDGYSDALLDVYNWFLERRKSLKISKLTILCLKLIYGKRNEFMQWRGNVDFELKE